MTPLDVVFLAAFFGGTGYWLGRRSRQGVRPDELRKIVAASYISGWLGEPIELDCADGVKVCHPTEHLKVMSPREDV